MTDVERARQLGADRRGEATGDDGPVDPRPGDRVVVTRQVLARLRAGVVEAGGREHVDVRAQDRLAEPARAAVDQQAQSLAPQAQRRERGLVVYGVDGLQLREVVAAADRAERVVELGGRQTGLGQRRDRVAVPGAVEVEAIGPAVALGLAGLEVGAPQAHAAADVVADQVRVEPARADEGGADRAALAGVEVGHPERGAHARQLRGRLELRDRLTLDPRARRGDDLDGRGGCRVGGVCHPWVGAPRVPRGCPPGPYTRRT